MESYTLPTSGPGYSGPRAIHYLFIDGGALRGRIKNLSEKFFQSAEFEINFAELMRQDFTKAFYYDAVPMRQQGEKEDDYFERIAPIQRVMDAAAEIDRIHVYEGDAIKRKRRGHEQKKVDIALAVDMLMHSFRKNMNEATLLTGDVDFKPLVDALVQDGMFVRLWYPPQETSPELIRAADARKALTMSTIANLLTTESRPAFDIPSAVHNRPQEPLPGSLIREWQSDGKRQAIYQDSERYILTSNQDANNRLDVTHTNYELLKFFCAESLGIITPG